MSWANDDTFRFFVHVLSCQIFNYYEDKDYVPVPWREAINRFIPKAETKELRNRGLVETLIINDDGQDFSKFEGLCREYKIADYIVDKFIELESIPATKYIIAPKVNLFTGKKTQAVSKSKVKDSNNNEYPKLIIKAIKSIGECIFELAPVEKHIADLENQMLFDRKAYGSDSTEYKRSRGQYHNDNACLKAILNQNPIEVSSGFYSFVPSYSPSYPGRIHTALQSASRKMKSAAFSGIEGVRNYDLRSSQIIGLIQQFQLAGLNTSWLENYKNNPFAKKEYAEQIGISIDCWKQSLCALLMGAYCPKNPKKSTEQIKDSNSKIIEYLYTEAIENLDLYLDYQIKFNQVTAPLKAQLDRWHEWLISDYIQTGRYVKGKLYISNPTDSLLCVTDLLSFLSLFLVLLEFQGFQ